MLLFSYLDTLPKQFHHNLYYRCKHASLCDTLCLFVTCYYSVSEQYYVKSYDRFHEIWWVYWASAVKELTVIEESEKANFLQAPKRCISHNVFHVIFSALAVPPPSYP